MYRAFSSSKLFMALSIDQDFVDAPGVVYQSVAVDPGKTKNLTKKKPLIVKLLVPPSTTLPREAFKQTLRVFLLYSDGKVPKVFVDDYRHPHGEFIHCGCEDSFYVDQVAHTSTYLLSSPTQITTLSGQNQIRRVERVSPRVPSVSKSF